MSARTRRRIAAASFGPEWIDGRIASWMLARGTPRERVRLAARLRDARRELAATEARHEDAA